MASPNILLFFPFRDEGAELNLHTLLSNIALAQAHHIRGALFSWNWTIWSNIDGSLSNQTQSQSPIIQIHKKTFLSDDIVTLKRNKLVFATFLVIKEWTTALPSRTIKMNLALGNNFNRKTPYFNVNGSLLHNLGAGSPCFTTTSKINEATASPII